MVQGFEVRYRIKHQLYAIAWLLNIAALGAWLAVMALDNEPPYVYDGVHSVIIPDPAPQGAMVTVDWRILKISRICPGQIQRFFTNKDTAEIVATLDTTEVSRAVRPGDQHLARAFVLPPNLPPNVGYFAEVRFQCNILQHLFPLRVLTPELTFHVQQH
ncbi:hypothetical protein ACVWZL_003329 [Bradyrhizobium sp. GM2.4]